MLLPHRLRFSSFIKEQPDRSSRGVEGTCCCRRRRPRRRELIALRLVSREWYELSEPVFWGVSITLGTAKRGLSLCTDRSTQVLSFHPGDKIVELEHFLDHITTGHMHHVKRASLLFRNYNNMDGPWDTDPLRNIFYRQFLKLFQELLSLEIDNVPTPFIPAAFTQLTHPRTVPHLISLRLLGMAGAELDSQTVSIALRQHPLLKSVELRYCTIKTQVHLEEAFAGLEHLRWLQVHDIGGRFRPSSLPPLTRLIIDCDINKQEQRVSQLVDLVGETLEFLGLVGGEEVFDSPTFPFDTSPHLPRLKTLSLAFNFPLLLLHLFDTIPIRALRLLRTRSTLTDPLSQDPTTLSTVVKSHSSSLRSVTIDEEDALVDTSWTPVERQCEELGVVWELAAWGWPDWSWE